jgi:2-C-methyl-D-erythritol 2,4-cyclodiphosphate synthase
LILLEKTLCLLRSLGYNLVNADMTVILEKPKLRPHIEKIRTSLANALNIDVDCISVKAKTAEGCGEVGKGKAVEAQAAVLLTSK